jgi:hypothetical protein
MITWLTQPLKSFASFYYYDKDKRILVRIRLELGRDPSRSGKDDGSTRAIFKKNRYVGFFIRDTIPPPPVDTRKFSVKDGKIVYDGNTILDDNPQEGLAVCDFTYPPVPPATVHTGNPVTKTENFPPDITLEILTKIAIKVAASGKSIVLTARDASPEDLSKALLAAAK